MLHTSIAHYILDFSYLGFNKLKNYKYFFEILLKNFKSETAKSSSARVFLWFLLKKGVQKWERRDSGNCPNDTKHNALERGCLGASFKLINSHINQFPSSLRWIKVMNILNFFLKNSHTRTRILRFFFKQGVHKWDRRDFGNCPNDTKHNALERGGLGASFKLINSHINQLSISLRLIKVIKILNFF